MECVYSNYLHIVPSSSSAGALKQILPRKAEIAFIQLDLETGALPDDLSQESYLNCKKTEYWDVGDGLSYKIFGADLSRYEGIIVWHSNDVRSMLILSMMCALYDGKIMSCNVSDKYPEAMVDNLAPQQLKTCLEKVVPVSKRKKLSFAQKYSSITHEQCVKRYIGKKFAIIPIEMLKQRLLRNVKNTPLTLHYIVCETMRKAQLGEFYSSVFWDCMVLELVCEGKLIISEMAMSRTEAFQYPLGCCMTNEYLLNNFDLRKLYTFKCFKSKVKPNFIIKNPKLCELQVDILRLMDFLSTDEKFIPTYKVVEAYYTNCSDTANGEPLRYLVDKIYAMAQPWRIKEPLLLSRGYIGAPEKVDSEYSGAADIFYTEIALSQNGKNLLTEYISKTYQ